MTWFKYPYRVNLAQIKWIVPINAGTNMYVDNVYFYKAATADPVKQL
jgi:hypothetical protein